MAVAEWDYIVVGAGHNGLSAGCTLAERGRSVLIVDQIPFIGGLSSSRPWISEAPGHLISVGAMDDMLMAQTSLVDDLGLKRFGYRDIPLEAPYGWINEDGDSLLLFRDFDRALEEIRKFSRRDARTYAELRPALDTVMDLVDRLFVQHPSAFGKREMGRLLLKLAPDKKMRKTLGRMMTTSVFEMISETFESDAMRGLWSYWTSMIGPADLDGTGMFLMAFHATHRKRGVLRPRGGMSGLMDAFAAKLAHHGGEINLGNAVEKVMVEGGQAVGVRMADGTEHRSRRGVLASCAPQVTMSKLLDSEDVPGEDLHAKASMIPANSVNSAAFKIDMAVGGKLSYPNAAARRRDGFDVRRTTLMTGTLEDQIHHLNELKLGRRVENPPVYMSVLSASDPTIAPDGQDVLYLHSNVPAQPQGGWQESKDLYTKTILDSAGRFLDGLDAEIGRTVHTPLDFEEYFGAPKGCYFHVDMTPLRLGVNRPAHGWGRYATPVDGLYLAGAGSHPGGTVNGWCGRLAGQEALKHEHDT